MARLPLIIHLHQHGDAESMAKAVAAELLATCRHAWEEQRVPLMALAGGSTPFPAYDRLALGLNDKPLQVIPTDERCVPHDQPACNLSALRMTFASAPGVRAVPITTADGDRNDSLELARNELATLPWFDATVLGMGADGHFASLFPDSAGLADALDLETPGDAIALMPARIPPEAPYERITLTLSRLLRSRRVLLVIGGNAKRDVLELALAVNADPIRCPVSALLRAAPGLVTHWSP